MGHINFSDFRQNLASYMDEVCDSRAPLTVTRQKGRAVVVMSEEEFASIQETLYLLSSPRNAELLRQGIRDLDEGRGVAFDPEAPAA